MAKLPTADIQTLLKTVVDHYDQQDLAVRDGQIRVWKQLKLLWEGFHRAWYSEVAHDWRIYDDAALGDSSNQSAYDKPINVFRAYLESIIAALSITVPPIKCFPDDANDPLDLSTARAGDKIAELVYRHNDVSLLWIHALFIYCTEGMVAYYNYPKASKEFGEYETDNYEDTEEQHEVTKCPSCGFVMDDQTLTPETIQLRAKLEKELYKFMPDDDDIMIQDELMNAGNDLCPACAQMIAPQVMQETLIVTRLVGTTKEAKSRMCIEAYGGLNVKIPNYARKQSEIPALIYSYEVDSSIAIENYRHLLGKRQAWKESQKIKASTGPRDPYEQWGRLNPQYRGEYPMDTVTVRSVWLRPSAFYILSEEADVEKLRKLYPNGCKVVMINDDFGEACNESLDDHWTINYNPLADYVHYDPLGLLLVSVQEITNDLVSLTLQTIEHGIPQTFADPAVLDFDAYRQQESTPGGIYEAKAQSGKSIKDGFHEVKTAALSQEVMPFGEQIQSMAQLVSGALPSLFGGQMGGSETASQYSMSRAQAQQRLQNTWKMFTTSWKQVFGKVIPMFIKTMKDDEREVQTDSDGNFFNVFIRKAETEGKLGKVELGADENLPVTWGQRKDFIEKLLLNANPEIIKIISAPENIPLIHEALGLADFYVPGEDDVMKQYDEIKLLLNSTPFQTGDPIMPEVPSVEIDPIFDNHAIEFEIVRKWVIGEAGRQAKQDNPEGYKNVLLHGMQHNMEIQKAMMQQAMQQQATEGGGAAPNEKPNPKLNEAPLTGEGDVQTIQ